MGIPYFDRSSVQRRLNNTICMWNGEPVYVTTDVQRRAGTTRLQTLDEFERVARRVRGTLNPDIVRVQVPEPATPPVQGDDNLVTAYKLPVDFNKPIQVDYTLPEFSYKAFPLGYMNYREAAYYLYRLPSRQQSQGLEQHYIRYVSSNTINDNWYLSAEMRNCILGVYPSIDQAREQIKNYTAASVAFCRECAIERAAAGYYTLLHRGRKIGYAEDESTRFRLYPSAESRALRYALKEKVAMI